MLLRKLSSYTVEKTVEKIRVKKRVKIVETRVMLKLVLILALFVAALSAPLGEVPRRPNPLAIHRTRGFYEGLLEFWTSGQEMEFWSRMSDKRIRVTQALEQDKATSLTFLPHLKRRYYEGLSTEGGVLPHFKRPDGITRDCHHNRRRSSGAG